MFLAVTVKPRGSNLDMQNLMNIVNSVNIPTGSQPQTFAVMSNLKANGSGFEDVRTAPPVAQSNIVQGMLWITCSSVIFFCLR